MSGSNPGWALGDVPTPDEWNSWWAKKLDTIDPFVMGGPYLPVANGNTLAPYAKLVSPIFTGNPTAPTATPGDADTSIATTAFVSAAIVAAINSSIFASPIFTGNPTAPTPTAGDNDTSIATTAFVTAAVSTGVSSVLASPIFTGNPTAPTPVTADNDTSIATTAFVKAQGYQTAANVTAALAASQPGSFSTLSASTGLTVTGTSNVIGSIRSIAAAGNAFVGSQQTAGTTPSTVGIWNLNNTLYFGSADTNGTPTVSRATLSPAGDLILSSVIAPAGLFIATGAAPFGLQEVGNKRYVLFVPSYYWQLDTSTGTMLWATGNGALWNMRVSDNLAFNQIGTVAGNGAYANISDAITKTEINDSKEGLEEVLGLMPKTFRRLSRVTDHEGEVGELELGFVAQDVQNVLPHAVRRIDPDGPDHPLLAVSLDPIVAALVNAIKDIDARLKTIGI